MSQEPPEPAVDDGENALSTDIAEFVKLENKGPWGLAYLVARQVTPGEGDGVRNEHQSRCFDRNTFRRVSARKFARRVGTSAKRVLAFLDAWNRLAEEGVVDHATDLHPDKEVELPDTSKYPFYGKNGYYRSWEATSLSPKRREAVEEEAEKSDPVLLPSPTFSVIPKRSRPLCWQMRRHD